MTLYEFKQLDTNEQMEAIWKGIHIGNRRDREHNIVLYQIDGFYAEVYHHKFDNDIKRVRTFSSTNCLDPYLDQIDIEAIFKK